MPGTDQLGAVGDSRADNRFHDPTGQHLPGRDHRFGARPLRAGLPTPAPGAGDLLRRQHGARTPRQPEQCTLGVERGTQTAMKVFRGQRLQTPAGGFEPRSPTGGAVPTVDRIERPGTEDLHLLRQRLPPHPRAPQTGGVGAQREGGEPVGVPDRVESSGAGNTRSHGPRARERWIGAHSLTPVQGLPQARVVHPDPGTETGVDQAALSRGEPQRHRTHMRRRALRPLTVPTHRPTPFPIPDMPLVLVPGGYPPSRVRQFPPPHETVIRSPPDESGGERSSSRSAN